MYTIYTQLDITIDIVCAIYTQRIYHAYTIYITIEGENSGQLAEANSGKFNLI